MTFHPSAVLLLIGLGFADTPRYAQPISMPEDRAQDSYAIYSQLLKSGPIEWREVPRKQWLIEDTTNAVPLDAACQPASGIDPIDMNPHEAIQAPEDRQTEWNQVLADYDQHCHDVIQLDAEGFHTELPVRLLDAEDQRRFTKESETTPAEFADGAGLHRFTEVFFNPNRTLALVEQGMWCGSTCGMWTWVVLERSAGQWHTLPWVNTVTVS